MAHRCIVFGYNSKSSLHLLPMNDEQHNDWTLFVRCQVWSPPTTSSLETERVYSGRRS